MCVKVKGKNGKSVKVVMVYTPSKTSNWPRENQGEDAKELQKTMDEFYSVCLRRRLNASVGKSKVIVCKRKQKVCEFCMPYRMSVPVAGSYKVVLGEERKK